VQGVTVATVQFALSTPTGEENYEIGQDQMGGDFGAKLDPDAATVRFLGRQVQESILMHDYCYFDRGPAAQLPDTYLNSSWTAATSNYYAGTGGIVDRIGLTGPGAQGWVEAWEGYIMNNNSHYSCSVSGSQAMYINGIAAPYETHAAGLYLSFDTVYAQRSNATVYVTNW